MKGDFYPFNQYIDDLSKTLDGTYKIYPSKYLITPIAPDPVSDFLTGVNAAQNQADWKDKRNRSVNYITSNLLDISDTPSNNNLFIGNDINFIGSDVHEGQTYFETYLQIPQPNQLNAYSTSLEHQNEWIKQIIYSSRPLTGDEVHYQQDDFKTAYTFDYNPSAKQPILYAYLREKVNNIWGTPVSIFGEYNESTQSTDALPLKTYTAIEPTGGKIIKQILVQAWGKFQSSADLTQEEISGLLDVISTSDYTNNDDWNPNNAADNQDWYSLTDFITRSRQNPIQTLYNNYTRMLVNHNNIYWVQFYRYKFMYIDDTIDDTWSTCVSGSSIFTYSSVHLPYETYQSVTKSYSPSTLVLMGDVSDIPNELTLGGTVRANFNGSMCIADISRYFTTDEVNNEQYPVPDTSHINMYFKMTFKSLTIDPGNVRPYTYPAPDPVVIDYLRKPSGDIIDFYSMLQVNQIGYKKSPIVISTLPGSFSGWQEESIPLSELSDAYPYIYCIKQQEGETITGADDNPTPTLLADRITVDTIRGDLDADQPLFEHPGSYDDTSFVVPAIVLFYNLYLASGEVVCRDMPLGIYVLDSEQTVSAGESWSTRIATKFAWAGSSVSSIVTSGNTFNTLQRVLEGMGEAIEKMNRIIDTAETDINSIKSYLDTIRRSGSINVPYLEGDTWYVNGLPAKINT